MPGTATPTDLPKLWQVYPPDATPHGFIICQVPNGKGEHFIITNADQAPCNREDIARRISEIPYHDRIVKELADKIAWLRKEAGDWIPEKDSKPNGDASVFIYIPTSDEPQQAGYWDGEYWRNTFGVIVHDISHWRPQFKAP